MGLSEDDSTRSEHTFPEMFGAGDKTHGTYLLVGHSSTKSRQRDGLDPELGPLAVQEVCLLLNLLSVGHEQGLDTNRTKNVSHMQHLTHTVSSAYTAHTPTTA